MNPYPCTVYCDLCGGPGAGSSRAAAAMWLRNERVYHTDPRVCDSYLAETRRKLATSTAEELERVANELKETVK